MKDRSLYEFGGSNYSGGQAGFPRASRVRRVTSPPKEHLLANYYGINVFDSSQRYLTILETWIQEHNPEASDVAALGMIDLKDNNKFIPLAQTYAWNFQQGCMLHWLSDQLVIYNDCRNERFVSVIRNVSNEEEEVIPYPISSVSSNGKLAVSINFARLHVTRPGYRYAGEGQYPRLDVAFPNSDGLFLIDLNRGESKLILSIADVEKLVPSRSDNAIKYFNHTLFNQDNSRIFFLARSFPAPWETVAFTIGSDGSNLRRLFPDGWEGSHFDWLTPKRLMVTCKFQGKEWAHVLFTDGRKNYQIIGAGALSDGHGTFSPNKKWLTSEVTHIDSAGLRTQTLILVNVATNALFPLERFPELPKYRNSWRCDLHPHWGPKSDVIAFNSSHEGSRQVYVIELSQEG